MSDKIYDVIVIGVGSMGVSTCYYAAQKNAKVLGIDQHQVPHTEGSHTGQSRIIRKAYFEHPNYVPLLEHAYQNWAKLEEEFGQKLFYKTGLYYAGKEEDILISGFLESARKHNIDFKNLSAQEVKKSYPQLQIPDAYTQVLEPDAGFVLPEKTIQCLKQNAIKHGAEIHEHEVVEGWRIERDLVVVKTNKASYQAEKLVITAGAGTGKIYPAIDSSLKVTRQSLFWVNMKNPERFTFPNMPCWNIDDPDMEGLFYGFPIIEEAQISGNRGFKLAHHVAQEIVDPYNYSRVIPEIEQQNIQQFLERYFPNAFESISATATCLYTNSPDEDFIIDHLPNTNKMVTLACGFSGHGFKFVPVIGDILSDLSLLGATELPISFLGIR